MVGKTLSHYKILEPLGAGGMGEVYLGEDTRLGRKVAIKVLPAEFASDAERLARFEQEARAAAALNHPHIAVVHDVGSEQDEDGTTAHFMVQEYLEGQSLRERLDKGALPLDKALTLATEVGEALVAAHKVGIIHRDLKPDNIFVTEGGHAKVLDFGLAKLVEVTAPVGSELSMSPTMLGTVAGQVMGTAGFMAPEQVKGEEVDQRADLFAFGCVLYGMITGRQAFGGRNVHETLGHILSDEPPAIAEIDTSSPPELQRIVRKLLAKDADRRYQTAGDLNVDLRQLKDDLAAGIALGQGTTPTPAAADESRSLARLVPWGIAMLALLVAAWALTASGRPDTDSEPLFLPLGEFPTAANTYRLFNLSSDGRRIVYVGDGQLQLLDLAAPQAAPKPIEGTENANTPFFSDDGAWIGFHQDGYLRKVGLGGALPEAIAPSKHVVGATWVDDRIVYSGDWADGIRSVSASDGGAPVQLALPNPDAGEQFINSPSLLLDGRYVLAGLWDTKWNVVVRAPGSDENMIYFTGHDPRYLASGHLVYAQDGNLLARTFAPESLESGEVQLGDPVLVVEDVVEDFPNGFAGYAVSAEGTLVYLRGTEEPTRQLWRVEIDGSRSLIREEREFYHVPTLSPDGAQLALGLRDPRKGTSELARIELASGRMTPLTNDIGNWNTGPVFAPDGQRILYSRLGTNRPLAIGVHSRAGDDAVPGSDGLGPNIVSWHPDGTIALDDYSGDSVKISVLRPGATEPEVIVDTLGREGHPRFSPSGDYLAYSSDVSGKQQVYVTHYPRQSGEDWPVSIEGGSWPRWSGNDDKLYFWSDNKIYVTEVLEGETFRTSQPLVFLEEIDSGWDIAADGTFVVTLNVQELPQLRMIQNFFEYLEERAPHR